MGAVPLPAGPFVVKGLGGRVLKVLVLRTSGDFWSFLALLKSLLGNMFLFFWGFLSKSKKCFGLCGPLRGATSA